MGKENWRSILFEISKNIFIDDTFVDFIERIFSITARDGKAAYEEVQMVLDHPETILREKILQEFEKNGHTRYVNTSEKAGLVSLLIHYQGDVFRGTLLRSLRNFIERDNNNRVCRLSPVSAVYHMYFELLPEEGDLASIFESYAKDETVPENRRHEYKTIAFYLRNPDNRMPEDDYKIVRKFFGYPPIQKTLTGQKILTI